MLTLENHRSVAYVQWGPQEAYPRAASNLMFTYTSAYKCFFLPNLISSDTHCVMGKGIVGNVVLSVSSEISRILEWSGSMVSW